jgi:hypothetical protein
MSALGLSVMLGMLSSNETTVNAVKTSLGKTIKSVKLENDLLKFEFDDNTKLNLWDDGQSCCESRYMRTDDNLEDFVGAILLDFELKEGPCIEEEHGNAHDQQFLDVKTSEGVFQMASHNEHNGYYGGFLIRASQGE